MKRETENSCCNKVAIVTVYNSLNSGSFLQATSLYKAIEKLGYDPSFLKTGARNLFLQAVTESIFLLKKLKFKEIFNKFRMALVFSKELKSFNVSDDFENSYAYVLGSDEIWNVARTNMAKHPVFWGKGLPMNRCISYAPSLNNATEAQLKGFDFVAEAMEKLASVSVRDEYSKAELEKISDRNIEVVCDPTVLLEAEDYLKIEAKVKEGDYILVYIYNKAVTEEDIKAIRAFAKKLNKKLVSFGSTMPWCDINVKGTAFDFLGYIHNADYVCTSTFHGTMLSSIYQKQFAVLGNKNRKVSELLMTLGLDRKADAKSLEDMLLTGYDKEGLSERLKEIREQGNSYLNNALESIQKN